MEQMLDQMCVKNHIDQMAHVSFILDVNVATKMIIVKHVTMDIEKTKIETAIFALIHSFLKEMILKEGQYVKVLCR